MRGDHVVLSLDIGELVQTVVLDGSVAGSVSATDQLVGQLSSDDVEGRVEPTPRVRTEVRATRRTVSGVRNTARVQGRISE